VYKYPLIVLFFTRQSIFAKHAGRPDLREAEVLQSIRQKSNLPEASSGAVTTITAQKRADSSIEKSD